MTALALILSAGLIWSLYRDNRRLLARNAATRTHCAGLLRHVRRQRNSYGDALDELWDEHCELQARTGELERELAAYRKEDARRDARMKEMLN